MSGQADEAASGRSSFAEYLNILITQEINKGTNPQDIVDELTREANLVFANCNLELEIAAHWGESGGKS
jgi:hypothetical protein